MHAKQGLGVKEKRKKEKLIQVLTKYIMKIKNKNNKK